MLQRDLVPLVKFYILWPSFYIYCPDYVGTTQRIYLDIMAQVPSWACVPGFYGTVKIRETVLD